MTLKTRAVLLAQANTTLQDNVTQEISPADVRGMAKDTVDSFVSKYGDIGILDKLQYNTDLTFTDDKDLVSKKYVDDLSLGLWDDRGNYDASTNLFPSTGGSGTAGAVLKGDIYTVSVAGVLGGVPVNIGDTVRALVDTPAQIASNWAIGENNFGYVPWSLDGQNLGAGTFKLGSLDNFDFSIVRNNINLINLTATGAEINNGSGNAMFKQHFAYASSGERTADFENGVLNNYSGNATLGWVTPTADIMIYGQGNTGGTFALKVQNSDLENIFIVRNDNNIGFNGSDFQDGIGVQYWADRLAAPTTNPIGGIIPYVESGVLRYRQPSGAIVVLDGTGSGVTSINGETGVVINYVKNNQTNAFGNFVQSFLTSRLKVFNPAATFGYLVTGSAIVADRAVNLPLLTGNDTFVFEAHAQTLINKTLTSPIINVGSDATGDVYYRNAGGAFTRLGVGANGQTLTLAAGVPSWATPASGTLTIGTTVIASGVAGRLLFEGTGNVLQETANFAWDITNNALILGGGALSDTTSIQMQLNSNANAYRSAVVKNASAGLLAAGDFTAIRDDGSYTANFLSVGINSSTYNDPTYPIQTAGSAYLFSNGGKLVIGTQTAHDIVIHTGGTTLADRAIVIRSSGASKGYLGLLEGNANEPTLLGKLHIVNEDDAKGTFFADRYSATMSPLLNLRRSRGTFVSPTAVQSLDGLGGIGFRGYGATGFSAGSRVSIIARASQNWTDAVQGTHVEFSTTLNGGIVTAEKMRLTNDGALWLGTTAGSASALLDLVSTTKGFGLPVMTTAQRDAITSPRDGLYIYSTDGTVGLSSYINGAWSSFGNLPARVTIPSPSSSENTTIFYTSKQIRVSRILSGIIGGTSVTFSIRYGADRSAAGTEVVTGGTACTNTTTGLSTTSFNNATIPANNFVWITTTAKSGAVTELNLSLAFN